MNSLPIPTPEPAEPSLLSRREAIQRTALLLGVAISPSILAGLLSAQVGPGGAGGRPSYLNPQQRATAAALAERIIPRTDTPGATDVGVPDFIDLMVGEFMTAEERTIFLAGLAEVEAKSTAAHQRSFAAQTPEQQDALLKGVAEASQNKEKTFFYQLKELTLLGYFTAEPVGKKVLHYDPVPGRFEPCVPISEVGNRAWTR